MSDTDLRLVTGREGMSFDTVTVDGTVKNDIALFDEDDGPIFAGDLTFNAFVFGESSASSGEGSSPKASSFPTVFPTSPAASLFSSKDSITFEVPIIKGNIRTDILFGQPFRGGKSAGSVGMGQFQGTETATVSMTKN